VTALVAVVDLRGRPVAEEAATAHLARSRTQPRATARIERPAPWVVLAAAYEDPAAIAVGRAGATALLDGYAEPVGSAPGAGPLAAAAALAAAGTAGHRFADRLAGNFAAIVWDAAREELLVARDQAGTRPLFYAERGGRLIVASEARAIVGHDQARWELEPLQVAAQLACVTLPDRSTTFWEGLARVPAEHVLRVRQGRPPSCERYSDLIACPRERGGAWGEALGEALGRAAARAVRGRTGAAVALSSGLDSTAVAAALAARAPTGAAVPPLAAVSFTYERFAAADESALVADTARRLGLAATFVAADGFVPLYDWPATGARDDQPPHGFGSRGYPELLAATPAEVLLTGHGSDHLFGPGPLTLFDDVAGSRADRRATWRDFRTYGAYPIPPLGLAARVAVARHAPAALRWARPALPGLLDAEYARRSGLADAIRTTFAAFANDAGRLRALRPFNDQHSQRFLEHYDAAGRGGPSELRHPYLDREVIALAARIAAGDLRSGLHTKLPHRDLLRGLVADEIVSRRAPKTLGGVVEAGLTGDQEALIGELMRGSRLAAIGALSEDAWWRARERVLAGSDADRWPVGGALTAEIWLRRALGEHTPAQVADAGLDG
jgi:asparagine synthetase B (glutamine-hydrolysing)